MKMHLDAACCVTMVAFILAISGASSSCIQGDEYYDSFSGQCVRCSQCKEPLVVLVPCYVFQDTMCAPADKVLSLANQEAGDFTKQRSKSDLLSLNHGVQLGDLVNIYSDQLRISQDPSSKKNYNDISSNNQKDKFNDQYELNLESLSQNRNLAEEDRSAYASEPNSLRFEFVILGVTLGVAATFMCVFLYILIRRAISQNAKREQNLQCAIMSELVAAPTSNDLVGSQSLARLNQVHSGSRPGLLATPLLSPPSSHPSTPRLGKLTRLSRPNSYTMDRVR